MDQTLIVKHYASGLFLADFIATMNWEYVGSWFVDEQVSDGDVPIFVKMLALIKVTRY
jgi:hypothetical protein